MEARKTRVSVASAPQRRRRSGRDWVATCLDDTRPNDSVIRRGFSIKRVYGVLLLIFAFIVIDISSARLRYHYRLITELTPVKIEIEATKYDYHGTVPIELQDCRAYDRENGKFLKNCTLAACEQNALLLSEKRQGILAHVRSQHPIAGHISELFDGARGVNQTDKISHLFSRKTCERIISSSDKTNRLIDIMSWIAGVGALLLLALGFKLLVFS